MQSKPKPKTKQNPGMKRSRTLWSTKLRPDMEPAVGDDPKGRGKILIPTPMLIAEEMSKVRKGKLITVPEVRNNLAKRFNADFTCPLCTGIFYNIIAGAAEEAIDAGKKPLAPYWRMIPENGVLSPKTPAGPERQAEHLRREGHRIESKKDKLVIAKMR
jgi:hypothetical protein